MAAELAAIFPDLKQRNLLKDLRASRKFLWIKRRISPEQKQAVHDIGDPGLLFGPREMRLYPNGKLARILWVARALAVKAFMPLKLSALLALKRTLTIVLRDPATKAPLGIVD